MIIRKFLALTLSLSLVLNPLVAMEVAVNQVSATQPFHALKAYKTGQYVVTLDKDLMSGLLSFLKGTKKVSPL